MFLWDEERVAVLTRMWKDGHSASEVAKSLGTQFGIYTTRNSVIGKVFRMGLGRPETAEKRKTRRYKKNNSARKEPSPGRVEKVAERPRPQPRAAPLPHIPSFPDVPNLGQRVSFIDRDRDQCSWITNDGDCCGLPAYRETSWCRNHARVVFVRRVVV